MGRKTPLTEKQLEQALDFIFVDGFSQQVVANKFKVSKNAIAGIVFRTKKKIIKETPEGEEPNWKGHSIDKKAGRRRASKPPVKRSAKNRDSLVEGTLPKPKKTRAKALSGPIDEIKTPQKSCEMVERMQLEEQEIIDRAIPFAIRSPKQCSWIIDKASEERGETMCCGQPVGKSYMQFCDHHLDRATNKHADIETSEENRKLKRKGLI